MAESTVQITRTVTSDTGATAQVSSPVRVAGCKTTFTSMAPAALITIQISNDGVNWSTGTNDENSDLSSLQSLTETIKERVEWLRVSVAQDASGPRLFTVMFNIIKVS